VPSVSVVTIVATVTTTVLVTIGQNVGRASTARKWSSVGMKIHAGGIWKVSAVGFTEVMAIHTRGRVRTKPSVIAVA
jgi:hypothetical protein